MVKLATETDAALAALYEEMRVRGAASLRDAAWAAFSRRGLPNRRVESWHYTDLKAALSSPAGFAATGATPVLPPALGLRLVTLDGVFRPDLSDLAALPESVKVQSLSEALAQGEPAIMSLLASDDIVNDDTLVSLNAALMQDGVALHIAAGAAVAQPIELATFTSGDTLHTAVTRTLVVVGEEARATIVETAATLGAAPAQTNHALLLRLARGASLDHVAHAGGGEAADVRVISLLARLEERARLSSFALLEGAGLTRRQIFARLDGEHAHVSLNGATLARGRQHVDTTLVVDHAKPHGESRERFRHILDEQGTGVFQGKIVVRPHAQKTDGVMQSKAILLSDGATMNNKPELEIFADDVQCGHGATCGRLDKDQLFYLMARGLPRREAESLLIEGFANEVFMDLENDALRARLAARITAWLSGRS